MNDKIIEHMKSLLEKLAPEEGHYGLNDHEEPLWCMFCSEYVPKHAPDCPWVEARKLLERLK
jgi:hypothetical protein